MCCCRMVKKMSKENMNLMAIMEKPGVLSYKEAPIPTPGEGEILVKSKSLGICGSDMHMYLGTYNCPCIYPVRIGHEWSGEVLKVGENAGDFKEGDRVATEGVIWCGECDNCGKDKNICSCIKKSGQTQDGYGAKYLLVKAKHTHKLPDNVDCELGSMTEPFSVAHHAITKTFDGVPTEADAQKRVLIMGGGPIGMAIAMLLIKKYNFQNVFVSELSEFRASFAQKIGAKKYTLQLEDKYIAQDYHEMYNMVDGFDVVFESTGISAILNKMFRIINPLGTIATLSPTQQIELTDGLLVLKSCKLVGCIGHGGEFPNILPTFEKDPEYFKQMVTHRFKFSEFEKALGVQKDDPNRMQIILTFDEE